MKTTLSLLLVFFVSLSYCQVPIDITDQTIKIGGMEEEILYFGFAEGDQIVLNFTEVDGKELKEIEIAEYPSISKYTDFKTAKIENKTITVNRQAIYQFRFYNGAVGGRICKIRIQRIPSSDQTKNFNSDVTWVTKQDTTWNTYTKDVLVGYDTTYRQITKKELIKTELKEELLLDKSQRVHTSLNSAGSKSYVFFSLPQAKTETYKTSKVVAWAYWVGVGQEGSEAWEQETENIVALAEGIASFYTTPLGALAIGTITSMMIPSSGDDVHYALVDLPGRDLFYAGQGFSAWDRGAGTAGYKRFVDAAMCKGTYYIVLNNDNYMDPIDVSVKVTTIIETKTYEDKQYTEEIVKARYEKKIFSDPVIREHRVLVMGK